MIRPLIDVVTKQPQAALPASLRGDHLGLDLSENRLTLLQAQAQRTEPHVALARSSSTVSSSFHLKGLP
jgi:hypothetical protein